MTGICALPSPLVSAANVRFLATAAQGCRSGTVQAVGGANRRFAAPNRPHTVVEGRSEPLIDEAQRLSTTLPDRGL